MGLAHPEGVRAGNSVISAPRPLAADPLFERAEAASEAEAAPLLALGLGPAAAEFGGHFLDLSDAVGTPSRGFLFDLRLRARRRLLEALLFSRGAFFPVFVECRAGFGDLAVERFERG
ncbi:MAG TPA: hypothetical protein VFD27_17835 [Chthoniobacteraceae bacterium]|nr:hypothetical protein [Chthoniobacteraceae bacterium]